MHRSLDKPAVGGETRTTRTASAPDPTHDLGGVPPALADGRYVITGFLGEGARKRVYLAHDERLDRDVAVALIPALGADDAARERIGAEARAMARLGSHPNIVTVHDYGEEGDAAYIVSEYMAQGSVAELLAAAGGKGLEIDRAARLARQVAAALAHAHRAGIVHRDVKPHNVFLNEDGHARLGDFGVALALDRPRLSGEGMGGTVDYMPPEQARNRPGPARSGAGRGWSAPPTTRRPSGRPPGPSRRAATSPRGARCSTTSSAGARRSAARTSSRSSPSTSTAPRSRRRGTGPTCPRCWRS